MLYPLKFQPLFLEKMWGGRKIETLLGKPLPPNKPIGESWELYDFPPGVVDGSRDWVSAEIANGPLAGLPFLPTASEPLPCRLDTPDLVEMLKFPTCVGAVRRVILDQLGNRYHRRFATHWNFVRYAQEQDLNLDFTTPPKRPDAKLPPLFQE